MSKLSVLRKLAYASALTSLAECLWVARVAMLGARRFAPLIAASALFTLASQSSRFSWSRVDGGSSSSSLLAEDAAAPPTAGSSSSSSSSNDDVGAAAAEAT